MGWFVHATSGLSDGQFFSVLVGVAVMVFTGYLMARDLWRRRRAPRPHPADRPYDWATSDVRLRQAVNVHRRAS